MAYYVDHDQLLQFAAAIRKQESGGNYNTVNRDSGAMGAYQFMPGTWASQARAAGVDPNDHSPGAQDRVALNNMTALFAKYGSWKAVAQAWYGGEGAVNASWADQPQYSGGHAYPSVNSYASQVLQKMGTATTGGASVAGTIGGNVTGAIQTLAAPKPQGNVPGVDPTAVNSDANLSPEDYFRKYLGYESWVLDVPELHQALMPVLQRRGSAGEIQAALEGTGWWKSHSTSMRQFDQLQSEDPEELNRQVTNATAQIQLMARKSGTNLDPARVHQMAEDSIHFGWDPSMLQLQVGNEVGRAAPDQIVQGGDIDATRLQVRQHAAAYFMPMDDVTATNWARRIVNGEATVQGVDAWAAGEQAKSHPEWSSELQSGLSMADLFSSHRQSIASILNVDPASIDFMNPKWQKVVDYVPPGETKPRSMTIAEASSYARGMPEYRLAPQANDLGARMSEMLETTFGKKAAV